eukprot:1824413-Lingulodinium_polyedra.AAC.1
MPNDQELKEWVETLEDHFGSDVAVWPKIGCGANFKPWAKGATMVVEMLNNGGKWMAFLSDRLPEQLDDVLKGHI